MGEAQLIPHGEVRAQAERLEQALAAIPQVGVSLTHTIAGGMYARTGTIPAGCVFTGAVHTRDHINVVIGDVSFFDETGVTRVNGHNVMACKAGAKRVAMTHSVVVWTTLVRTDLTDVTAIENELVEQPETLQNRKSEISQQVHFLKG